MLVKQSSPTATPDPPLREAGRRTTDTARHPWCKRTVQNPLAIDHNTGERVYHRNSSRPVTSQ